MNVPTDLGNVFIPSHSRKRIEQHSIDENYVVGLIDLCNRWKSSGGRLVGWHNRDGVNWRIVLEKEEDDGHNHEYDLVTVVPQDVNTEKAEQSGKWTSVEVMNLALYSNSK